MGINTEAMRTETRASPMAQRLLWGAVAGLAGGVVFGAIMGMMGMLPMVAGLVSSGSPVVGAFVHMVISAIIGAGFGLVAGARSQSYGPAAVAGLVYGAAWWVLGPLLIMPSLMGMGPQLSTALAPPMLMSLVGHLMYGLVTAVTYAFLTGRVRNA